VKPADRALVPKWIENARKRIALLDQNIINKTREEQQILADFAADDDESGLTRLVAVEQSLVTSKIEKYKLLDEIASEQLTQPSAPSSPEVEVVELSEDESSPPTRPNTPPVTRILSQSQAPVAVSVPAPVPAKASVSVEDEFEDIWILPEDDLFLWPPLEATAAPPPPPPRGVLSFDNLVLDKLTTERLKSLMSFCGLKAKESRPFMIASLKRFQRYLTGRVCTDEAASDGETKSSKKRKTDKQSAFDWFENFIRADEELYDKIVVFETLSLQGVHAMMKERNGGQVPGNLKLLRDFFEATGIQFSAALGSSKSK